MKGEKKKRKGRRIEGKRQQGRKKEAKFGMKTKEGEEKKLIKIESILRAEKGISLQTHF